MNIFRPSTWFATTPQPLQVNPNDASALVRHVGRLATLFAASRKEKRSDVLRDIGREIAQRQAAIERYGHVAPDNELEARALLRKVQGE